ncbi:unnamed protein product [Thlaspi arvense]|uniref:GED domain-containing protein n=1 Tax=Thlaspi arvense TaxID=13288 RepID=A0AAU9S2P0_THLAR|nr:unnamed protein product [Thlaspi arvense]
MGIIGLSKDSLRKIMLRAEFDEYPDDENMHCTSRLTEMLGNFTQKLQKSAEDNSTENFLFEEIRVLEEIKGIWLPNFLPRQGFLTMLQRKLNKISHLPLDFMGEVWDYIEKVVNAVLMCHSDGYPQLQSSIRRAANNLVEKMKRKAFDRVTEMVEMEKVTDYTYNLVNQEIEKEIVNHMVGGQGNGIERMLEECPSIAIKREKLNKSIKLLKESKEVVAEIMDRNF